MANKKKSTKKVEEIIETKVEAVEETVEKAKKVKKTKEEKIADKVAKKEVAKKKKEKAKVRKVEIANKKKELEKEIDDIYDSIKDSKKNIKAEKKNIKTAKKENKGKAAKATRDELVNTYKRSITSIKNDIKESRKLISKKETERSNVGKNPKDTFFGDVMQEMHLVKWPSKLDMVKYSIATLVFVLFFAGFFYVIDFLVATLKNLIG